MKRALRPEVLVIADVPSPHQSVFFDAVADLGEVELEILFCRRVMPGRAWSGEGPRKARHHFVSGVNVGSTTLNFTLIPWLRRRPEAVVFLIGYYLPGMLTAGLYLGVRSRPWVFWMDALKPLSQTALRQRALVWAARRWFLGHANALLSSGTLGRAALLREGADPAKLFEIPFVVDVAGIRVDVERARVRRQQIRANHGIQADSRVLLFVGQMIRRKGIDLLIQATGALKSGNQRLELLLVGDGPDKDDFIAQAMASPCAGSIHFAPNRDISRLPDLWAAADALILPSRFDAWGVVVDEALAAGLPVIGSNASGAVLDHVEHEKTGWIFQTGDLGSLTEALAKFLALDHEQLRAMGTLARSSAGKWDPRLVAKHFTTIVDAVARRRPLAE